MERYSPVNWTTTWTNSCSGSTGELGYRVRVARFGIYLATIAVDDAGTYGLPPLGRAALRRIKPPGMMVLGQEVQTRVPCIKSSANYWPQVWWCVPVGQEQILASGQTWICAPSR
jgi:hypothetical protein